MFDKKFLMTGSEPWSSDAGRDCFANWTTHTLPILNSCLLSKFVFFLKKWAIPCLFFFIFVFSIQITVNVQYNFLPMTGFEPRTSGVGSNRATYWATTTALNPYFLHDPFQTTTSMATFTSTMTSTSLTPARSKGPRRRSSDSPSSTIPSTRPCTRTTSARSKPRSGIGSSSSWETGKIPKLKSSKPKCLS